MLPPAVVEYHQEFCACLMSFLTDAWLPEDQWTTKSGPWVAPSGEAAAGSAAPSTTTKATAVAPAQESQRPHSLLLASKCRAERKRLKAVVSSAQVVQIARQRTGVLPCNPSCSN